MLLGPDLNSWKVGFDFADAKAQGCTVAYVKLGGDNQPRYASGSYPTFVDDARAQDFRVGHMWVTGGTDIPGSASFFFNNLHDWRTGDFIVLDNETFPAEVEDGSRSWTDAESATWFRLVLDRLGNPPAFLYGSRDNDLARHEWPETLALPVDAISAIYNNQPLVNYVPSTIPAGRVKGHQYTSSASIGGLTAIDMNAFTDDAFNPGGFLMALTDQQQQAIYDAIFTGGTSMGDEGKSISQSLGEIHAAIAAPVDVDALATAIVAKLPTSNVTVDDIRGLLSGLTFKTSV